MIKKEIEIYSVDEKMPESEEFVLFFWKNKQGYERMSYGFYARKYEVESEDEDFCIYDSENDMYYLRKGWYESGWELENIASVCEKVTHWASIKKLEVK